MNYEDIKKEIEEITKASADSGGSRIEQELAPLKEVMLKARQQGVTLKRLYDLLCKKGFKGSASSFAKYAQHHLQRTGKAKKTKTIPVKTTAEVPPKQESIPPISPSATKTKPRVAGGDY